MDIMNWSTGYLVDLSGTVSYRNCE